MRMSWTLYSVMNVIRKPVRPMLLKVLDMTRVCPHQGLERRCAQTTQHTFTPCMSPDTQIHNRVRLMERFPIPQSNILNCACPIQPYLVYPPSCSESELQDDGWLQRCTLGLGVKWSYVNEQCVGRGLYITWPLETATWLDINVKKQKKHVFDVCCLFNRLLLLAKFHTGLHKSKYAYT